MFKSATLAPRLDKASYKELEPRLREDLLNAQFELIEGRKRTILVLINGLDGSGKGEVLNRLYEWLDAHYLATMTYERPTEQEQERPPAWKYWRELPAYGYIGAVLGSWYHEALRARALGRLSAAQYSRSLESINRFEAMLSSEGVVVVKLWLMVQAQEMERRRQKSRAPGHVVREWDEIQRGKETQRLARAALEMARVTSTGSAPWYVVPAADPHYRDAQVGTILLETLRRVNATAQQTDADAGNGEHYNVVSLPKPSVLQTLDLSQTIAPGAYTKSLNAEQGRLTRLTRSKKFQHRGLVCVFEGNDAAGKGGTIGRVRQALDPRRFRVHQIGAPTDEERGRPYLWRFWRHIPPHGYTVFFDRSWYGRVLVERVEGLCSEAAWRRAYSEINDFELQLAEAGYIVVKFWLAISQEEQLRRFEAREAVPFKRFKITDEDWRNRDKWPVYEEALTEMVDRTSTNYAPWVLVEAEQKRFARVKVLKAIADRLEAAF